MEIVKILREGQLVESKMSDDPEKRIYLEGIFLQSNIVNGNNRRYDKSWFKGVVDQYITEKVNTGMAIGELTHPDYFEVNPKTYTHKIVSLIEDGDNWIGKLLVGRHTKDYGQIRSMVEDGIPLGVSSRAAGSVKTNSKGIHEVQKSGFRLSTAADIVLTPSAPDAYVNAIMEQKEYIWDGGDLVEVKLLKAVDMVNKAHQNGNVKGEALIKLMNNILKTLD